MYSVYLIESISKQGEVYVGASSDPRRSLEGRDAGKSFHTGKFRPLRLSAHLGFWERRKAEAFERYLKSGSGHAFANKRLW